MYLGIRLALVALFAVAGWHHATSLEKRYGRPAWGLPAVVWGAITGLSLLLGAILLAVAERGLKKQPAPQPFYGGPPAPGLPLPGSPAYGAAVQQQVPAYGMPEQQQVPAYGMPEQQQVPAYGMPEQQQVPVQQVPVQQAPVQQVPVPVAGGAPAGWAPDPSGRHQYRWWDGAAWTRTVATDGVTTTEA